MSSMTSLNIDNDTKALIKETQKIIHQKKKVNFDLKDIVYLVFKSSEKVADLVSENFNVEMDFYGIK